MQGLIAFVAIVNPVGAAPVFISLLPDATQAERSRVARTAAFAVAIILVTSVWAGESILGFFGVSIAAFRAAGGLLILLMAIAMMRARQSDTRHTAAEAREAEEKDDVGVVPLAIPLMAGPGAISLAVVRAHEASGWQGQLSLSLAAILTAVAVWLVLRLAAPMGRRLGATGVNIATRLMGLLLAAIGIEFLAAGVRELFPSL